MRCGTYQSAPPRPRTVLGDDQSRFVTDRSRRALDGADDGLGEAQAVVEAGLVGQEAVAVGVDQLDDLERLAAVPGRGGGEQRRPSRRGRRGRTGSAGRCRAGRRARRRAGSRCRPGTGRRRARSGPRACDRREPEHDDVGERDVGREPDRVRVAGARRVAVASGGTGSTANPSVSIIHSIFSACGRWKSGSSTGVRPYRAGRRYRHRRRHVPVPAAPRWMAFHLLVHRGDRADGQPRVLAAAPARRAPGVQRRGRSRIDLPPAPLDDVLVAGADPDDVEWRPVTATGRTCPTSSSSSSTAPRAASPATWSSRRWRSTTGGSCSSSAASCRSAQASPAAPAGTVDVVGRLRPSQERRTGQLSDRSDGRPDRGPARRHRRGSPRSCPAPARADVRRAGLVGTRRGEPYPQSR